jgi:glutamyl-tRNA reductase
MPMRTSCQPMRLAHRHDRQENARPWVQQPNTVFMKKEQMALKAFGINHTTASLDVREELAFSPSEAAVALRDALDSGVVREAALLSTCNRTEFYCDSEQDAQSLLVWLSARKNISPERIGDAWYCFEGLEASRHIMKVACGLDSMVLGEPQILGQIKDSYAQAKQQSSLGAVLHSTFQHVFSTAKKVRSETAIGAFPVSVAYAAVSLAKQIFSDLSQDCALLVGAGETIELVARHLREQGISKIIVANRTLENARKLASEFEGEAILLSQIPERIHEADIVITSTASQLPLLGKGTLEAALKKRRHKPMFIVDIAVPRDVEPQVAELADVFLYTVDDLKEVIDENQRSREKAAAMAEDIIDESVKNYAAELRSLNSVDTIRAFRTHVNDLAAIELEKAKRALAAGKSANEVLESLSNKLSNKFMHQPSLSLRRAAENKDNSLEQAIKKLFLSD